mmetsp:Transcript_147067/g.256766  ORF Transcript_147067/g.256766 Transcript_147067/m.256766 type:complete len:284 (+) Transcript_147067:1166-2017(+)
MARISGDPSHSDCEGTANSMALWRSSRNWSSCDRQRSRLSWSCEKITSGRSLDMDCTSTSSAGAMGLQRCSRSQRSAVLTASFRHISSSCELDMTRSASRPLSCTRNSSNTRSSGNGSRASGGGFWLRCCLMVLLMNGCTILSKACTTPDRRDRFTPARCRSASLYKPTKAPVSCDNRGESATCRALARTSAGGWLRRYLRSASSISALGTTGSPMHFRSMVSIVSVITDLIVLNVRCVSNARPPETGGRALPPRHTPLRSSSSSLKRSAVWSLRQASDPSLR